MEYVRCMMGFGRSLSDGRWFASVNQLILSRVKEVSKSGNYEKMKELFDVCVFVFISSWRCNPSAGEAGDV